LQPLKSLTVIDLTDGNYFAGSMFADYGATVIKIEKPDLGDRLRQRGRPGEEGRYHSYYDRAKKSITLDISTSEGQGILKKLIRKADMFLTNLSLEQINEYDLSYETLKALKKDLVYGLLTPFGEEGPWREYPDYDLLVMSRSGLQENTGFPEEPTRLGFPLSYMYSGWLLSAGMLAAYIRAKKTGEGAKVSNSSWHMMMSVDDTYVENLLGLNVLPKRIGNGFPTTNPTDTFRCKNGWFSLSIGTDKQWISFARECGRDDWAEDPKYAHDPARSMENYFGDLDQQLNDYFETITVQEADEICRRAMVPGGPCNTIAELIEDEQVSSREMILEMLDSDGQKSLQIGKAAKFSKENEMDNNLAPAPELGEHTEEILDQLGINREERAALKEQGII
jgi:CoA:oxalate CoA-transferase